MERAKGLHMLCYKTTYVRERKLKETTEKAQANKLFLPLLFLSLQKGSALMTSRSPRASIRRRTAAAPPPQLFGKGVRLGRGGTQTVRGGASEAVGEVGGGDQGHGAEDPSLARDVRHGGGGGARLRRGGVPPPRGQHPHQLLAVRRPQQPPALPAKIANLLKLRLKARKEAAAHNKQSRPQEITLREHEIEGRCHGREDDDNDDDDDFRIDEFLNDPANCAIDLTLDCETDHDDRRLCDIYDAAEPNCPRNGRGEGPGSEFGHKVGELEGGRRRRGRRGSWISS
uniref:Uncharacterized protein n=1 Tax=Ananas comosus var. bracteatus TaxID=296719 RepID=A0A6V7QDN7_ANACO|nr:unnamed protein product [Ananas comosus var. bracteatus]